MNENEILKRISVLNRDNGEKFTDTARLDVIASLLWDSRYRRVNPQGLYHLYAVRPLTEYREPVVIISSHVDCEKNISRCFTKESENGFLKGTYDNSITNAAVLSLMLREELADHVLIAFTGDEERGSKGAKQLAKYLKRKGVRVSCVIVLDVTDMGWKEKADYTIENNFWGEELGRSVASCIQKISKESSSTWRFVPSDTGKIPSCILPEAVIFEEAEADESWEYDEQELPCFSFCLPVCGDMHSDEGVYVRKESFSMYIEALKELVKAVGDV